MATVKINNNAASRLASSLTAVATSLSVTAGEGAKFPSPAAGEWFPVTLLKDSGQIEILRCTARSGDVLTVARGQEGTAAISFNAGDRIELRITAAALAEFMQDSQFSTFIKTLIEDPDAATARETLGLGSAATLTATTSNADTTSGRALRVGDFAIGAAADSLVIPYPTALDSTTDLNSIISPGWYNKLVGAAAGSRNPNHPDGQAAMVTGGGVVNYYWILVNRYSGARAQIAIPYISGTDTSHCLIKYRHFNGTSWTVWKTLATDAYPFAYLSAASTTDIGSTSENVNIIGTTTISSFGTAPEGKKRTLIFSGSLTITHNATSLILPGSANIVTAAGDVAEFVSLGSGNWRCTNYVKANGGSLGVNTDQLANAWVNFNGTGVVAIRDSYNVSSVTDNGTGDYTVNFSTSMANANYQVAASVGPTNGSTPNGVVIGAGPALGTNVDPTTSGFRVLSVHSGSTLVDNARIGLSVFGGK